MAERESRVFHLAFFGAAAVLYAVFLWQYVRHSPFASVPVVDAHYYWNIAVKTGILGRPFPDRLFSAPLYPLFLTATVFVVGFSLTAVYVVQMILGLSAVGLIMATTRRLYGLWPGRVAGILLVLYFPLAYYAAKALPEVLAIFVLSGVLFLYVRPDTAKKTGQAALLGLALGLACLVRSQFVPLVAVLVLAWPWYSRISWGVRPGALKTATAAGLAVVVVLSWGVFNKVHSGSFALSPPNGGVTFYQGNNPLAGGTYTPIPGLPGDISLQLDGMVTLASKQAGRDLTIKEADRHFWKKGLAFISDHPVEWLRLELKKFALAVSDEETGLMYDVDSERQNHVSIGPVFVVHWAFLMVLAVLGLGTSVGAGRQAAVRTAPVWFTALVLFGFLLAFYVSARYRLLLLPAVAPLAGAGLMACLTWWKQGRKALAAAVLVVLAVVFVHGQRPGAADPSSHNNLAYVLLKQKRWAEAEELCETAFAEHPRDYLTLNNWITALIMQDKCREAAPLVDRLARTGEYREQVGIFYEKLKECPRDGVPGSGAESGSRPGP